MPDRRARRAAIWIVGGFVALDLAMIAIVRMGLYSFNHFNVPTFFLLALVFAQASLAAVWAVISTHHLTPRLAMALLWLGVGAFTWLVATPGLTDLDYYVYLLILVCAHAGVVAILLLVGRARRAALERDGILVSKGLPQFSIRNSLIFTAAVALVLALNARFGWFERNVQLDASIAVAAWVLPAVGAVWAILGGGRIGVRLVVLVGVVLIGMLAFVSAQEGGISWDLDDYGMAAWTFTFLTVLVAIPLFIFRRLGYRFTRRRTSGVHENVRAT